MWKNSFGFEAWVFWGDEEIESDITVITLPQDSVVLFPCQG